MYYSLKNIRTLLAEGFNDRELRRFCYDEPALKPVYHQFAEHTGKIEIIDRLLEYAEQRNLLELILRLVKENNPTKYEECFPHIFSPLSNQLISENNNQRAFAAKTFGHIQEQSAIPFLEAQLRPDYPWLRAKAEICLLITELVTALSSGSHPPFDDVLNELNFLYIRIHRNSLRLRNIKNDEIRNAEIKGSIEVNLGEDRPPFTVWFLAAQDRKGKGT